MADDSLIDPLDGSMQQRERFHRCRPDCSNFENDRLLKAVFDFILSVSQILKQIMLVYFLCLNTQIYEILEEQRIIKKSLMFQFIKYFEWNYV